MNPHANHTANPVDRRVCVAPMMKWTDRHDRFFLRLISRRAVLYAEMLTTGAVLNGDRERLLGFDPAEHPVALQFGGNDPAALAACAEIAADFGYDEVNLNVGCPSDRVRSGAFGACLMADPALVARCVAAMADASALPVTVKTRIGIDDQDSYAFLREFVGTVADAGCATFIIHARKAVLGGLTPKQNREIPPLRYEQVYRLKRDFPALEIIINGGVDSIAAAQAHLETVDGVMIGRAAYQNPYLLAAVDQVFYDAEPTPLARHDVVEALLPYITAQIERGTPLHAMSRHILGLFQGVRGGRAWRRHLSTYGPRPNADADVVRTAAALVSG